MSKDKIKKEEEKEEVKVDVKKKEPAKSNDKLSMVDFFESNEKTKGKYNAYAAGFKVWFKKTKEKSELERNSLKGWNEFFEEFLKTPIKD